MQVSGPFFLVAVTRSCSTAVHTANYAPFPGYPNFRASWCPSTVDQLERAVAKKDGGDACDSTEKQRA